MNSKKVLRVPDASLSTMSVFALNALSQSPVNEQQAQITRSARLGKTGVQQFDDHRSIQELDLPQERNKW
jgi:hypothetical protein